MTSSINVNLWLEEDAILEPDQQSKCLTIITPDRNHVVRLWLGGVVATDNERVEAIDRMIEQLQALRLIWLGKAVGDRPFLSADEVDAIGLDSTGRDGSPRWPYRESSLTGDEYARLRDYRIKAEYEHKTTRIR